MEARRTQSVAQEPILIASGLVIAAITLWRVGGDR